MQKRNKKNSFQIERKSKKKPLLLFLVIATALLLAGLAVFMVVYGFGRQASQDNAPTEETIHYAPATDDEKKAADDHKQEIVDKESQSNEQPSSNANISLVVTDASQYNDTVEVRAYSPDLYEEGGTCTYVFTKGSLTVTRSTAAHKDAKTTYCTTLSVPRSDFSESGTWNLDISLVSASGKGKATAKVSLQ